MTYEYSIVRCPVTPDQSTVAPTEGYAAVIRAEAEKGWRLVQVLVPNPAVSASHYDLIFERPNDLAPMQHPT